MNPSSELYRPLVEVPIGLPNEALIEHVRNRVTEAKQTERIAASIPDPAMRPHLEPAHEQALDLWLNQGWEWYRAASHAGIPSECWRYDLLDQEWQTPPVLVMRQFLDEEPDDDDPFADERGRALIETGPTGCGKTAAMIAGARYSPIRDIAFFRFGSLVRDLLSDDARDETLKRAIECKLLLIDDLGAAYLKADGLAESLLEEILCERELEQKALLGTSNLRAAQLEERLGDRVSDRLAGRWGRIVEVRGPSLRRRALGVVQEGQR